MYRCTIQTKCDGAKLPSGGDRISHKLQRRNSDRNFAGVSYAYLLKIKSCVTSLDAFSQKARGFTATLVLIAAESIDWKMILSSKFR
ncbi:hypothetical protein [Brasilonema octagenarum]|uniref:Uncharacterized protein n=1 Tax=Brasilonema octagenarum UFV-OR1 TaxID=417115 RepID=A0ABX1MF90_9CYAN|nr:hypothetical protein [Brasilonema octagenarum]NMF67313.1 hypothetical protein [Brasilonema octagenarum UFV-OR1]